MAYSAYITRLKNVRPHPNANRMKLADCFGNTVCVGLDYEEGQLGVYFPTDGQLSVEFCAQHDLVRRKDENGNPAGGYLDPNKRNVTAVRLRGEKSDGLFMPLACLEYTGVDLSTLHEGDSFTVINGHEICCKYIPRRNPSRISDRSGNKTRKKKVDIAPLFQEHADTEQLAYNLDAFKPGDEIEITLKMHGTSQRTAYLPTWDGKTYAAETSFKAFITRLAFGKLKRKLVEKWCKPAYDWDYVTGTRHVVLENFGEGGYYGSNEFRGQHHDVFKGKLWKGETVYYEVVGFDHNGRPIMSEADNKKLNDKEFIKQYGKTTVFSYGCYPNGRKESKYPKTQGTTEVTMTNVKNGQTFTCTANDIKVYEPAPQSDIYVYRMTMTNEDGNVVEYTPDFMRYRCEQMGVKTVPTLWRGTIPTRFQINEFLIYDENYPTNDYTPGDWVKHFAELYYDGTDPIGKTHIREGVVVRILNRPKFTAYKHKNFNFKVLSNIAIAQAEENNTLENYSEDILSEI